MGYCAESDDVDKDYDPDQRQTMRFFLDDVTTLRLTPHDAIAMSGGAQKAMTSIKATMSTVGRTNPRRGMSFAWRAR